MKYKIMISVLILILIGILTFVGIYTYQNFDQIKNWIKNIDVTNTNVDKNEDSIDNLIDKLKLPSEFSSADSALEVYQISPEKLILSSSYDNEGLYCYDLTNDDCFAVSTMGTSWRPVFILDNGDQFLSNNCNTDNSGSFIMYDYSEDTFIKLAELKVRYMNRLNENIFVLSSGFDSGYFVGFRFLYLDTLEITFPDLENNIGMGFDYWYSLGGDNYLVLSNRYSFSAVHKYNLSTNELIRLDNADYSVKSVIKLKDDKYLVVYQNSAYIFNNFDNSMTELEVPLTAGNYSVPSLSGSCKVNENIVFISGYYGCYRYDIDLNSMEVITDFGGSYDSFVDNGDGTFTISSSEEGFSFDYDSIDGVVLNYYYDSME